MKIDDAQLEMLGKRYREACCGSDLLVIDNWVVYFEGFIQWYFKYRSGWRGSVEEFASLYLFPRDRRQVSA